MKLNGPDKNLPFKAFPERKLTPEQLNQTKESLDSMVDSARLQPLSDSFQLLAQHDRKASYLETTRIPKNLQAGYEALVDFKTADEKTFVLAVREESDVPAYAALMAGREVDPELQKLHLHLKTAELAGHRFYLARGKSHLATDSAGAALSLNRGSRVVFQRSDGEFETHNGWKSAVSFLSQTDQKVAEARRRLEQIEAPGITLSPHNHGDSDSKESTLSRILGAFGGNSQLEFERTLAESLAKTGKVDVSFADDERPLPLPLALSQEELEVAANWERSTQPSVKLFKNRFKKQTDKKTIFMTQHTHGEMKGMVVRADDRAAYFQLSQGERLVALDGKGQLHELKSLEDFEKFHRAGRVGKAASKPFDGEKIDSDNLMMFYHVSPFDPIEKGNYDDLPQRITQIGSSEQVDIITMRSDLPTKRNLRVERAQKGELQEIKRLDPSLAMNDPKVLEDFIYETVSSNLGDDRIRFLVGGHGGAEKGLLPDGEHNNAEANHAMSVDNFAGAISKALDRVEKETGRRPKIDNLMLVSCLMGNTSFIHALAQTGDIETLLASPELMAGSNPISTFGFLNDPKTSKAGGREYAEYLLEEWSQAPAAIGGDKSQHHASTIGAYDLSPEKAKRFQKALGGFFEAALAEPKYAEYLKENIARAPSYGINPLINVMFDVDNRDLLQVLDHASKDARIKSPKLKKAIQELQAASEAQALGQKVAEDYEGRRGPSLYLPLDDWDFDPKMGETALLKSVKYKEFMEMIFKAPLQRGVTAGLINEVSRLSETGALDKAIKKLQDSAKESLRPKSDRQEDYAGAEIPESLRDAPGDSKELKETKAGLRDYVANLTGKEADALTDLHSLEEAKEKGLLSKVGGFLNGTVKGALGLAGGAVAGAVVAVPALLFGGLAGARAGWTGVSAAGTHEPASKAEMDVLTKVVDEFMEANPEIFEADEPSEEHKTGEISEPDQEKDPDLSPLEGLFEGRVAKGIKQLLLVPSEKVGIKTHENVGRAYGELPGRIAGAVTGFFSGAVLNTLAVSGVAFAGVGLLTGAKVGDAIDKITPHGPEKGVGLHLGRFEPLGTLAKD